MNDNILNDLKIQIYTDLPQDIKDKVNTYNHENGGVEDTRSNEQRELDHDKHYAKPYKHIYAFNSIDEVIACVLLFSREITFNNNKVKLGGIGGVSTAINERKKGIATHLLKVAMSKLKEDDHDVAFLNTDIDAPKLRGLYERQGFVVLKNSYNFTGKFGKEYFAEDGMIAPLNSNEMFQVILNSDQTLDIGAGNW